MPVVHGSFEVSLSPDGDELDGRASRVTFTKTYTGDVVGSGRGIMLSGGSPATKTAGYVAFETFDGTLGGHDGGFALQQFGTMSDGETTLHYVIVPGSGTDGLATISGELALTIEPDGTHRYSLTYEL